MGNIVSHIVSPIVRFFGFAYNDNVPPPAKRQRYDVPIAAPTPANVSWRRRNAGRRAAFLQRRRPEIVQPQIQSEAAENGIQAASDNARHSMERNEETVPDRRRKIPTRPPVEVKARRPPLKAMVLKSRPASELCNSKAKVLMKEAESKPNVPWRTPVAATGGTKANVPASERDQEKAEQTVANAVLDQKSCPKLSVRRPPLKSIRPKLTAKQQFRKATAKAWKRHFEQREIGECVQALGKEAPNELEPRKTMLKAKQQFRKATARAWKRHFDKSEPAAEPRQIDHHEACKQRAADYTCEQPLGKEASNELEPRKTMLKAMPAKPIAEQQPKEANATTLKRGCRKCKTEAVQRAIGERVQDLGKETPNELEPRKTMLKALPAKPIAEQQPREANATTLKRGFRKVKAEAGQQEIGESVQLLGKEVSQVEPNRLMPEAIAAEPIVEQQPREANAATLKRGLCEGKEKAALFDSFNAEEGKQISAERMCQQPLGKEAASLVDNRQATLEAFADKSTVEQQPRDANAATLKRGFRKVKAEAGQQEIGDCVQPLGKEVSQVERNRLMPKAIAAELIVEQQPEEANATTLKRGFREVKEEAELLDSVNAEEGKQISAERMCQQPLGKEAASVVDTRQAMLEAIAEKSTVEQQPSEANAEVLRHAVGKKMKLSPSRCKEAATTESPCRAECNEECVPKRKSPKRNMQPDLCPPSWKTAPRKIAQHRMFGNTETEALFAKCAKATMKFGNRLVIPSNGCPMEVACGNIGSNMLAHGLRTDFKYKNMDKKRNYQQSVMEIDEMDYETCGSALKASSTELTLDQQPGNDMLEVWPTSVSKADGDTMGAQMQILPQGIAQELEPVVSDCKINEEDPSAIHRKLLQEHQPSSGSHSNGKLSKEDAAESGTQLAVPFNVAAGAGETAQIDLAPENNSNEDHAEGEVYSSALETAQQVEAATPIPPMVAALIGPSPCMSFNAGKSTCGPEALSEKPQSSAKKQKSKKASASAEVKERLANKKEPGVNSLEVQLVPPVFGSSELNVESAGSSHAQTDKNSTTSDKLDISKDLFWRSHDKNADVQSKCISCADEEQQSVPNNEAELSEGNAVEPQQSTIATEQEPIDEKEEIAPNISLNEPTAQVVDYQELRGSLFQRLDIIKENMANQTKEAQEEQRDYRRKVIDEPKENKSFIPVNICSLPREMLFELFSHTTLHDRCNIQESCSFLRREVQNFVQYELWKELKEQPQSELMIIQLATKFYLLYSEELGPVFCASLQWQRKGTRLGKNLNTDSIIKVLKNFYCAVAHGAVVAPRKCLRLSFCLSLLALLKAFDSKMCKIVTKKNKKQQLCIKAVLQGNWLGHRLPLLYKPVINARNTEFLLEAAELLYKSRNINSSAPHICQDVLMYGSCLNPQLCADKKVTYTLTLTGPPAESELLSECIEQELETALFMPEHLLEWEDDISFNLLVEYRMRSKKTLRESY